MDDVCTDNRFELIAKYKAKLVEATNIETDKAEMDVIDNVLFRFWQMGWLDILEQVVRCKECKFNWKNGGDCVSDPDWFCADGKRKDDDE